MADAFFNFGRVFFPLPLFTLLVLYSAFLHEKDDVLGELVSPLQKELGGATGELEQRIEASKARLKALARHVVIDEYLAAPDQERLAQITLLLTGLV